MSEKKEYVEEGNVVRPLEWYSSDDDENAIPEGYLQDEASILAFMLETVSPHHAHRPQLEALQQTFAAKGRLNVDQNEWLTNWYVNRMRVIEARDHERQAKVAAREKLAAERAAFKAEKEAERAAFKAEMKAERAALKQLKAEIAVERAALKRELAEIKRERAALEKSKGNP